MIDLLVVVLLALACYRLVRLVQVDRFPGWVNIRTRLLDRADTPHASATVRATAELLTCPWCLSFWVAAGLLGFVIVTPAILGGFIVFVLALSAAVGLIADRRG